VLQAALIMRYRASGLTVSFFNRGCALLWHRTRPAGLACGARLFVSGFGLGISRGQFLGS